jgi:protocatechuate 3,4-dioxygenase beta subunit
VRDSLVEIWQANAPGRYHHPGDNHDAPLDPELPGIGRTFTTREGIYRFVTIKPGSYPWQNHPFAWRPQHIHFSLLGNAPGAAPRHADVFPGDPLLAIDPVYQSIPTRRRGALICTLT